MFYFPLLILPPSSNLCFLLSLSLFSITHICLFRLFMRENYMAVWICLFLLILTIKYYSKIISLFYEPQYKLAGTPSPLYPLLPSLLSLSLSPLPSPPPLSPPPSPLLLPSFSLSPPLPSPFYLSLPSDPHSGEIKNIRERQQETTEAKAAIAEERRREKEEEKRERTIEEFDMEHPELGRKPGVFISFHSLFSFCYVLLCFVMF